ncbi:MAG: ThiF family adenylyltransferase [Kiritimatiellales bacterium]
MKNGIVEQRDDGITGNDFNLPPFHQSIIPILNSGYCAAIVLAGGGSGALHALLQTPGASRFICNAQIPYSPEALESFTGGKTEHAVSPDTVKKMAAAALQKNAGATIGIAVTAALQTDRNRRGDDRAFICIKTGAAEKLFALYFSPAPRARQEKILSAWLLILIAQAVGVERGLMLAGSFNPPHQGHFNLLRAAGKLTGLTGIFELSCINADKPGIEQDECLQRAANFRDIPVVLTSAPRFSQKATLFPATTFVLGYDTVVRLIAYAAPEEWELYKKNSARFLIAGRLCSGKFQMLDDAELPPGFETLFTFIPPEIFREDISSTALRAGMKSEVRIPDFKNLNKFLRTEMLIGKPALEQLQKTHVIIFGVGGVGSWCAEALIRSGVGHLTMVDNDVVAETNINRQLPATTLTIGQSKVDALKTRLLEINPAAEITALQKIYNQETRTGFHLTDFDYVIDAIDSLSCKVDLISTAMQSGTTLFSAMGAACKLDATQIRIDSIWKTHGCRLARFVRKKLRRAGAHGDCLCVYSRETADAPGEDFSAAGDVRSELEAQTNGSTVHITGTFGFYLAGLVIQDIAQQNQA